MNQDFSTKTIKEFHSLVLESYKTELDTTIKGENTREV